MNWNDQPGVKAFMLPGPASRNNLMINFHPGLPQKERNTSSPEVSRIADPKVHHITFQKILENIAKFMYVPGSKMTNKRP